MCWATRASWQLITHSLHVVLKLASVQVLHLLLHLFEVLSQLRARCAEARTHIRAWAGALWLRGLWRSSDAALDARLTISTRLVLPPDAGGVFSILETCSGAAAGLVRSKICLRASFVRQARCSH